MTKIIAIIPARSGSKGIKNKNLIDFCGKPLMSWSISTTIESKVFDRVLVSTDCPKIAKVANAYGAETPFLRPKVLSEDHIHSVHVIIHCLEFLKKSENYEADGVAMLLPTSPLRSVNDIRRSVEIYKINNDESVIGIIGLGKNLNNLRFFENNTLRFLSNDIDPNRQRQGQLEIYTVNGAIFISNVKNLIKSKTFHTKGAKGFVMTKNNSIDINSYSDLELAKEMYLKNA